MVFFGLVLFVQCFDTVGWVIWPVKSRPHMTYNVLLNQSINQELLDIWHGLQQSAVDSAIDGERIFASKYGPREDILSSNNMLIEWVVTEAVKQCSKFVECVFQIG